MQPDPPVTDAPLLTRTVVDSGLNNPWDIAFAPDGALFYTERCAGLSVRRVDGSRTRLFGTTGSALVATDFFCAGQSGMHGVALDPDFATNRRVYVYMASNITTSPRANRVVRLQLDAGYPTASARTDIVTGLAFKDVVNAIGGTGAHNGGRIRFGPDGFLYIGTGDNHNPVLPQHPTLLGGKVLRVTTSGAAAPGNNPPSGFDARIYTYGHRNVQGLAFRPGTGQAFSAEHGPNHSDEVTPLVAGGNGGWDPQSLAWNGWLAMGIMSGQRLVILELDAAGLAVRAVNAAVPAARYRALTQGPDGALYVATDAGEIWRVRPSVAPAVRE